MDRSFLINLISTETNRRVQSGPFAGMQLLDLSNRGDGDIPPKLLGTYEQDTQPFITECGRRNYDAIIDVGCAEGYYAIGLARMFPGVPVLAFDTDEVALEILAKTAVLNNVTHQIVGGSFCDPATLRAAFERYPRSLVIADCEGYEKLLFSDGATNTAGRRSDLLIECHDMGDPAITPTILNALAGTHDITVVKPGARNPNAFPYIARLPEWDRWLAVWERREAPQNWLICRGKDRDT